MTFTDDQKEWIHTRACKIMNTFHNKPKCTCPHEDTHQDDCPYVNWTDEHWQWAMDQAADELKDKQVGFLGQVKDILEGR